LLDNSEVFSHAFAPRVDEDGYSYGLNAGMVGIGADNSKSRIDNVAVQVLPPEITLETTEDFSGTAAGLFTAQTGEWSVRDERYEATLGEGAESAISTTWLNVAPASLLQLATTFSTQAMGGVIFDQNSPTTFKFVAISVDTNQVIVGHHTERRGWVIDAAVNRTIAAGADYQLEVTLKGTTVSVSIDGQAVLGHVFNAVVVDGDFGLITRGAASSFNSFTVRTDDPAYVPASAAAAAAPAAMDAVVPDGAILVVDANQNDSESNLISVFQVGGYATVDYATLPLSDGNRDRLFDRRALLTATQTAEYRRGQKKQRELVTDVARANGVDRGLLFREPEFLHVLHEDKHSIQEVLQSKKLESDKFSSLIDQLMQDNRVIDDLFGEF
jgi:hypothetical protein